MAKPKQERKKEKPAEGADKKGKQKTSAEEARSENFVEEKVPVRLLSHYRSKVIPELIKKFNYGNQMRAPKLQKICINVGVGAAATEPKLIEQTVKDIESITGQKPSVVKAKKSVSNFKLREGMNIGVRVTLRNDRMYEFLDRFVNVTIPRIRDFRGLSDKSFDGRGNYSVGVKEHIIFPEVNVDNVSRIFGMDITFVTSAGTDEESFELLRLFGLPFVKQEAIQTI